MYVRVNHRLELLLSLFVRTPNFKLYKVRNIEWNDNISDIPEVKSRYS